jgi:hypothetical protein
VKPHKKPLEGVSVSSMLSSTGGCATAVALEINFALWIMVGCLVNVASFPLEILRCVIGQIPASKEQQRQKQAPNKEKSSDVRAPCQ